MGSSPSKCSRTSTWQRRSTLRIRASESLVVPPSWELKKYFIVVTSFARCNSSINGQWVETLPPPTNIRPTISTTRLGGIVPSPSGGGGFSSSRNHNWKRSRGTGDSTTRTMLSWMDESPLLQLRWLRLVVMDDEEGSCRSKTSSAAPTTRMDGTTTRNLQRIAAERRWVVGGIPSSTSTSASWMAHTTNEGIFDPQFENLVKHLFILRHPKSRCSTMAPKKLLDDGDDDDDDDDDYDDDPDGYNSNNERVWTFHRLDGHEGPFLSDHPRYNGKCAWNVKVVWEEEEYDSDSNGTPITTREPLCSLIEDAPRTCAMYAQQHNLLSTIGWKEKLASIEDVTVHDTKWCGV
jgi:hypothetical protein